MKKKMKIGLHDVKRIRETLPIETNLIRKIHNKVCIYDILNVLNSNIKMKEKRNYIFSLKTLDRTTLVTIWERYQGDMWVSSSIYDNNYEN